MPEPILKLEEVSKTYRTKGSMFGGRAAGLVKALQCVSLEVLKGEIFGLVGESGSGKTTAGRLIVKLESPESGRVLLNGEVLSTLRGRRLKAYRRRVQMIFQDPYQSLNPQLSIYESVVEPITIHRLAAGRERMERVLSMIQTVGLSPPESFVNRYPHQLSGGQRQRVAIARAMVLEPDFVVADEPTSMLDASYSAKIFNIILEMRKRFGITILFITHSLAAARYLCDRIAVIYRGHLMEVGTAAEVIHHPLHPYTRALIDALPKFGLAEQIPRYNTLLEEERAGVEAVGCPFFMRCRKAHRTQCGREVPGLEPVGPGRFVACFFPGNGGGAGGKGS
ncbi:MAG: ATP-binding cassette domain-containing protein [Deltaproteobacteria bacterium]|nr:ATP-binding cassette domain-containing protein [Deltaproteobacteria bacterium]